MKVKNQHLEKKHKQKLNDLKAAEGVIGFE